MIKWTCCECGNKYTKQTGDTDERMCDECLNHEHEFGKEAYDIGSNGIINDPDDGSWVGR